MTTFNGGTAIVLTIRNKCKFWAFRCREWNTVVQCPGNKYDFPVHFLYDVIAVGNEDFSAFGEVQFWTILLWNSRTKSEWVQNLALAPDFYVLRD